MNEQNKLRNPPPPPPHCSFCHKTRVNGSPLVPVHGKFICTSCLKDINVKIKQEA